MMRATDRQHTLLLPAAIRHIKSAATLRRKFSGFDLSFWIKQIFIKKYRDFCWCCPVGEVKKSGENLRICVSAASCQRSPNHITLYWLKDVLLDGETGVENLSFAEMHITSPVFLTHLHLDYIAVLPPIVDAIAARRTSPAQIHALQAAMDALKLHTFQQHDLAGFLNIFSLGAPFIHFFNIDE